uniref:Uncharacterized protein n=1 Tax=Loxodonta africana TaxID=9785 RepID=G3TJX5_LOXAF
MRSTLLFAAILAVSLIQSCRAACEESQEQVVPGRGHSKVRHPPAVPTLRRLLDSRSVYLDGLLKMLSKASLGKQQPRGQRGDMHDFFVGLMGKRNIQP